MVWAKCRSRLVGIMLTFTDTSEYISKSEDSWHDLIWKALPGAVAKVLDTAHLARRSLGYMHLARYSIVCLSLARCILPNYSKAALQFYASPTLCRKRHSIIACEHSNPLITSTYYSGRGVGNS
jgi:hypothetical protein